MSRDATKQQYSTALIHLLETKSVEKTSVSSIANAAHLSRKTFYECFVDKYDLVNWTFKQLFDKTFGNITDASNWQMYTKKLICGYLEYPTFYTEAFRCKCQNSLIEYATSAMETFYGQLIEERMAGLMDSRMRFAMRSFCIGGVAMIAEWAKNGMKESPEELTLCFWMAIPDCIRRWL